MKIISSSSLFGYKSAYWTNTKTLNPKSPLSQQKDAKYPAFNTFAFSSIRLCIGSPDQNCVDHSFNKEYSSARALFSAGYIRDPTLKQEGFDDAFGVKGQRKCGMQVLFWGYNRPIDVFSYESQGRTGPVKPFP